MHTTKRFLFVLASAALALACSLSSVGLPSGSPPVSPVPAASNTPLPAATSPSAPAVTELAAPTNTAPAVSSPAATGTQITFGTLHIWIPDSLATGTTNSTVTDVEFPYMNPSNGDMPQHAKIVLSGYPAQGTMLDPQVLVFPAAQYAQYADLTGQIVLTLQDMQYMDGQPLPPGLPDGPFNAHVGAVNFANGHGIRYLTQFDQAPLPVNNQELIYYFHGLTDDSATYVEAVLPVQAAFLPPDNNPNSPLPSGGVPFNMDDLGSYFQAIADKLNATPPDQFTPPLAALDALLQSISVK